MLCNYGCNNQGIIQFKNGKWCCSVKSNSCPVIKEKIGSKSRGRILSEEWRAKIGESSKGKILGPQSTEHKEKLSKVRKGKTPWNKGLTIDDPRVASYANKQKGQVREGNYVSSNKWKGENNPWYGKNRSKDRSPRYNGEEYNRQLRDYRNKITWLTEQTYSKYHSLINPKNYPRTLAGEENGYHLDHIYPISKGFENNIPPELMASLENLRIINWKENVVKGNTIEEKIIPESIKYYLLRL